MIRNGKPPIKAVNIGPPIIPQNPATKDYVDNIPTPNFPQLHFQGIVDIDRVIQGYIPTGVNTTFSFSVLGGLLYKNGEFGNELPQTPIRRNFIIRSIRVFNNSVSQNETILEITFIKDDVEFERYELTIPARSRNSNVIDITPGILPFFSGEYAYATIKISGAIAANFCTITLTQQYVVDGIVQPFDKDTAMQVKDTAKQQPNAQNIYPGKKIKIKMKTISEKLLSIFR